MPTLEITTMIGCPLMCTFCPQPGLKTAYEKRGNDRRDRDAKYMSFENFAHMLAKVPKHVRIDFSGMAEPWANPDCTRMLRHTLENGYRVAVFSTLYGMSESDAGEVVDLLRAHNSQVDVVCLHLADANGNMPGWKHSAEWENVFLKFRSFMEENCIPRFELMTMDGSGATHPALEHLGLNLQGWKGHTRAGSLDEQQVEGQHLVTETPRHETAIGCAATPFYDHNVVLPNGDVVLCCMDYSMKHVIGNLMEQDYYDLFTGAEINRLRRINMTPGFSACSLCKSCSSTYDYEVGEDARWTTAGDPIAVRDAQIAEYRYHLGRIEASPWWKLGMAATNLFRGRLSRSRSGE